MASNYLQTSYRRHTRLDELNKVLSFSKWFAVSVGILTALAAILNQVVTEKIAVLQKRDKAIAQERLKVSEEELAETRSRTAELENFRIRTIAETAALKSQVAHRQISPENRALFIKAVEHSMKGAVLVACAAGDLEAHGFAVQIKSMLSEAGFNVAEKITPIQNNHGPPNVGVEIGIKSKDFEPPFVKPLQDAFEMIQIHVTKRVQEAVLTPDSIFVSIGVKPNL